MPERASTTLTRNVVQALANAAIKAGGICCTRKRLAGTSAGISGSTSCSVAGPPVEIPIATPLLTGYLPKHRTGSRAERVCGVLGLRSVIEKALQNAAARASK